MNDDLDRWWSETARQIEPRVYWHVQFDPFAARQCLVGAINLPGGSMGAKCHISDPLYKERNPDLVKLIVNSVVSHLDVDRAIPTSGYCG